MSTDEASTLLCDCSTPYLIGCETALLASFGRSPPDDAVIVDLDRGAVRRAPDTGWFDHTRPPFASLTAELQRCMGGHGAPFKPLRAQVTVHWPSTDLSLTFHDLPLTSRRPSMTSLRPTSHLPPSHLPPACAPRPHARASSSTCSSLAAASSELPQPKRTSRPTLASRCCRRLPLIADC